LHRLKEMNKKTNIIIFFVIILATFSRLFITIPNFTAIGSLALFCGAILGRHKFSMLIPFMALLAGDLILALTDKLHADYLFSTGYFIFVYLGFALTWLIGKTLKNRLKIGNVVLASLASSVSFFVITNFGSWLQIAFYPKTLAGLGEAYWNGIIFYRPELFGSFFWNLVMADLFFNLLFFGGYILVKNMNSKLEPIRLKS